LDQSVIWVCRKNSQGLPLVTRRIASKSMGKIGSESWQRLCRKRHNADIAALNHIIRQKDEQIHELKEELREYRAASRLMKTKEGISG